MLRIFIVYPSHKGYEFLLGFLSTVKNTSISNMVYLEHPVYVEVGRRSRPFSLYKWF
jgi:hypothetical protein